MAQTAERTSVLGEHRLLIDGELVDARSGATFDNVDPTTGQVLGSTADAGAEDLDRAIDAAHRASDEGSWGSDAGFRSRCLEQLHAALVDAREEFREVIIAEVGAPRMLTHAVQCDMPIDQIPFYVDLVKRYEYERALPPAEIMGLSVRRLFRHEPVGVIGAITPWNFPMQLNLAKVVPALAAGCTVVLKAAPETPWTATLLGRVIAEQTDIPAGVMNVIASSDHSIGAQLSADSRVDGISFTGSTATGRAVMASAAATIKRVFLELGGKSANIVLDDANFEEVVPGASRMCIHAGQGCALPTRLLLPASRYDEGVELVTEAFRRVPYGDPTRPDVMMGPLVSERQRERVLGYIEQGRREGRVTTGGGIPVDQPDGFFVEPTVIADVTPDAVVAQEEIFGPVIVVMPFEDDDDAVRIANNSIYGLSGALHSGSLDRALAVARRIHTGTLSVNNAHYFAVDTPFGGMRQSGIGKEGGVEGFEEFLDLKVIAMPAG